VFIFNANVLASAVAVRAARIFQNLPGGGGLTPTEQLPASNASSSATALFPSGTTVSNANMSASIIGPAGPTVIPFTGSAARVANGAALAAMGLLTGLLMWCL